MTVSRDFKGIWIPREIWLHQSLSIQAKALWAEIWSLHDREVGGCYASNEYLCEFMNLKQSRLTEILRELKDNGLLEDVSFDGRRKIIKAIVPDTEYQEKRKQTGKQPTGIPVSSLPENRQAHYRDPGTSHIYSNKDKKKEQQQEAPSACVVVSSQSNNNTDSLDELSITAAMKESIRKTNSSEKINVAVERVLAWHNRESDAAAITTVLQRCDSWDDNTKSFKEKNNHDSNTYF